ncbi:MAG: hypothetical protein RLZ37_849, partial [Actinomycetota bacterium]
MPVKVAQGSFTTGNTNVSGLDSGWDHSCARQSDTLRCWGRGTHYQLGTGSTNNASTPTNVGTGVDFVNSGFVTAVSAGERHTCAIEAGRLFCWGDNGSGRLGNGSTTAATAPVLVSPSDVVGFMNTSQVTAVSAGQEHTCAIENKVVYCWGGNMDGQLGLGQLFGPPPTKPTKVFVVSAPDAPSISVMSQNAALSVTVTKPSDGGSTITSYEYQVDSGAIVSEPFSGFNSQTITISGLTNGTSYNVRVRAVNAIGAGAWSVTSGGMPSAGVNPNPNPNPNNPQPQQCTTGAYTFTGSSPVLDTSWGTSGWTSLAPGGGFFASRAILATPDSNDNNYLLLSNTMGQNFDALAIHKFDATGTLVSGFGTGGMLTIESQSADLGFRGYAVDAAGSILVITQDYSQPQPTFNVVGLTSTGLLDTSFANSGFLSVTLPPSSSLAGWNSIYGGSAGEFFIVSGVFGQASTYSIQKFNSSGLVNGFGTAGVLDVTSVGGRSMAVLQDGSLLVGGAVQGQLNLSKYSSAGVLDTAWATNGVSTFGNPNSIESISDLDVSGQSVIVTYRSNVFVQNGPPQSKNGVAKVGLDGVVDTTFGDAGGVLAPQRTGATFAPEGHVLSDGSIVVGLFSDTGFMAQTYGLIRFSATGDLDTAFASNDARITHGTCGVEYAGLADLGSGAVLVAGSKSPGGNMAPTESVLAKLTFSTVVPGINGGGFTGSGSNPNPNPNPNPGPNNNVFVPVTPPTTPPTDDEDDEPRVPGRPNLVNDDNRPGLVRPPGQSGLVVDGETQEVVTTRIETPGSNVQPNRRTPAQIQQIREAANSLVQ